MVSAVSTASTRVVTPHRAARVVWLGFFSWLVGACVPDTVQPPRAVCAARVKPVHVRGIRRPRSGRCSQTLPGARLGRGVRGGPTEKGGGTAQDGAAKKKRRKKKRPAAAGAGAGAGGGGAGAGKGGVNYAGWIAPIVCLVIIALAVRHCVCFAYVHTPRPRSIFTLLFNLSLFCYLIWCGGHSRGRLACVVWCGWVVNTGESRHVQHAHVGCDDRGKDAKSHAATILGLVFAPVYTT